MNTLKTALGGLLLSCLVFAIATAADQNASKPSASTSRDSEQNIWLKRYQDLQASKKIVPAKLPVVAQPLAPNAMVNVASPAPPADQTSATVSASEFFLGEFNAAWTDPIGPGPGAPTFVGVGWSPAGGIPGSWLPPASGPLLPPPPAAIISMRHPSMGSHPLGGHIMGYQSWGGGAGYLGGSAIWSDANFGGGGPWGAFGPAALVMANGPVDYLDYPRVVIDDWLGNPAPDFGAALYSYTDFIDGNGGDLDGNGNPFDEAPDISPLLFSYSNTLGGPFPYPAISPPILVSNPGPPSRALQSDMDVVSPAGAGFLPPGAVYVAWTGANLAPAPPMVAPPPEGLAFFPTAVYIDASPAPGAGAPFGAIPGAGGLNVMVAPVVPIGPVIGGGTQAMSTVTVAVNNATHPNPCLPGAVYVAWADGSLGDPDIFFSASFAGGGPGTWTPPVRVNQDPVASGLDQWSPSMAVDSLGNINIIFYDRRNDPFFNTATEVWMASSFDCGVSWTDMPLSDGGPVVPATTIPPGYIGDYIELDENALNGAGSIWNDSRPTFASQEVWFENIKPTCTAKAGDANASNNFTLSDVIAIVNYVFNKPGWPICPSNTTLCWLSDLLCRGDWNGSGNVTLSDVIQAVNFVFNKPGGPWTPIPIGQCCASVP